jgi:hypothetical protein
MTKLLTGIFFVLLLTLTGCASSAATPVSESSGLHGKEISTYLIGEYVDATTAKMKLENAGFEIVALYSPIEKGITILFTNGALKAEGAKLGKAHIAVSRLFIDEKERKISFTNPIYFAKAYMQDDYNHLVFNAILEKINGAFPELHTSVDKMKYEDLAEYHFMVGMPYYNDVAGLGEGTNSDLLNKARDYKKGASLVFELKLSENSTLLGYELSNRTKKFVKKIGRANAAILPYTVSIENGKASSLEAKYYIALCYPLLTMREFTTIATVPGSITKDLEKPYK